MDEKEQMRLLKLLNSVEKEDREEENRALADRDCLRRQLFVGGEQEDNGDNEPAVEREGSDDSEDNLEEDVSDRASEVSLEDLEEGRLENVVVGTENYDDGNEPNIQTVRENVYTNFILSRDGNTKWNTHMDTSNLRGRVRQHNIIRGERSGVRLPCSRDEASVVRTPIESFKLFCPDEMIDHIVDCTNIWIDINRTSYVRERDAKPTNKDEIHAVVGLLYLAGIMKSSHANLEDLWASDGFGVEYFRATMSMKRFRFLLRAMRFDDIRTRKQRRATDKLAPIRQLFEDFVNRCKKCYSLSSHVTVDEMLEAFRGKCSFRQYIPNKPAKYGLKMFALCDSRTFYTSNLEVYVGKQPPGQFQQSNSSIDVTMRMIEHISGTGRHLTVDNWYGSVTLAKQLLHNHRITMVSTLRKNKKEIPPVFIDKKVRKPCTSLFAYQSDVTLLSYTPNKNKCVLLLSTLHHDDEIDETSGDKQKPVILTCYNKYKGGVDTVDHMKNAYSVARKSNRWPLTLFFSLINIAGINSFVILRSNIENAGNRRDFLKTLVRELCKNQLNSRAILPKIPTNLRTRIRELTGQQAVQPLPQGEDANRPKTGRCHLCGRKKNRKSSTRCSQCQWFVCREHTRFSCVQCVGGQEESSSDDDNV